MKLMISIFVLIYKMTMSYDSTCASWLLPMFQQKQLLTFVLHMPHYFLPLCLCPSQSLCLDIHTLLGLRCDHLQELSLSSVPYGW